MERRSFLVAAFLATTSAAALPAETIQVRHIQRPMHRSMVARSEAGNEIAKGDFTQVVRGDEVTMRLTYSFVDGSIDDETTTYRQQSTFRLVRYHHLQKGPFFTKPIDFTIEAATGIVSSRVVDKKGKIQTDSKHMNLPEDLANGFVGTLLLNVPHDVRPFRVGMLAPAGGGRLIPLLISLAERAGGAIGRTDLQGNGVSHSPGAKRLREGVCAVARPSAKRCDGVGFRR